MIIVKILLGIFLLLVLWSIGRIIVKNVFYSIENRAIRKARVKETLDLKTREITTMIDPQIEKSKDAMSTLCEMAFEKLPGLEGRISRYNRQYNYIRFGHPYYKKRGNYVIRKQDSRDTAEKPC